MNKRERISVFFQFLRDEGTYTDYMNGFIRRHGSVTDDILIRFLLQYPPEEWVIRGLSWIRQPIPFEKGKRWGTVHNKWKDIVKTLQNTPR